MNNMLKVRKQLRAQYVVSIQNQLSMQSGTVRFLDSYGRVYSNQRNGVVSLEIRFQDWVDYNTRVDVGKDMEGQNWTTVFLAALSK